jgi:hypothetical protein
MAQGCSTLELSIVLIQIVPLSGETSASKSNISQATLFLTMFCRVNGTGHSLVVKDGGYLPCMSSLTTRIERSVMARIVTVSDQICLTHDEN